MTTDTKELLTYAAKAAGIDVIPMEIKNVTKQGDDRFIGFLRADTGYWFSPHTSDGDSARLRTTMGINVKWYADEVMVFVPTPLTFEERFSDHSGDKDAALRAATLKLAAEIGRRME